MRKIYRKLTWKPALAPELHSMKRNIELFKAGIVSRTWNSRMKRRLKNLIENEN